jgi:hypothetical protein
MSANNVLTEKITYSVCINSTNKISGSNNNCSFYIPWVTILPGKYDVYKVIYNFQSVGGYYKDVAGGISNTSAKLLCDFGTRSMTYDTSQNGPSQTMGIITRDLQSASAVVVNTFSAFFYQNTSKCIGRPQNNQINIQIINNYNNLPLVNTDSSGNPLSDMTAWSLFLEFIPVQNETSNLSRSYD